MLVIELPTPSALFDIGKNWVQRIEILVRDREASGVCYVRYYSYNPGDGGVRVVDADRAVAEAFFVALKQRLMPASTP